MSFLSGTAEVEAAEVPVVRILPEKPTLWTYLERLGAVASAVAAAGILVGLLRKRKP